MDTILKCNNVCKNIGNKQILNDITFSISEGDIFGLIGPNGAGKTTLIKLITHLQTIDNGNIYINDFDINKDYDKALNYVGAIVENPDFYMYLSGLENLKLKQRLSSTTISELNEIIHLVKLDDRINDKVSKYSLGMRQRLGIALALINKPKLLIFDEPTNGLDPDGIKDLRDILFKLSNCGVSILISSHILKELDDICNKICIIKDGNIIANGNINEIKDSEKSFIFEADSLENINLSFKYNIISDSKIRVYTKKELIPIIIESLVKSNVKIYSVSEYITSLEDVFLKEVGEYD